MILSQLTTRIPSSESTYANVQHTLVENPAIVAAWLLTMENGVSGASLQAEFVRLDRNTVFEVPNVRIKRDVDQGMCRTYQTC